MRGWQAQSQFSVVLSDTAAHKPCRVDLQGVRRNYTMAGEKETPAALMTRLLKDRLVPRMVSEGAFGKDWRLQSVEVEPVGGLGEDHWTSITMSVTLHLAESNSNAKKRYAQWGGYYLAVSQPLHRHSQL